MAAMPAPEDPAAVLARHASALATVRDFGRRSGAERVVVVIDGGEPGEATMVEWRPGGTPLAVTEDATTWAVPDESAAAVAPIALPEVRPVPGSAISVDAGTGEIAAPIGTLEHLAGAVAGLARAFGGRSVAAADFTTADPELSLTIAARRGEPVLVEIGETQYELPGSEA
jgi:hypothetical protein